jgi:hypothetical protein
MITKTSTLIEVCFEVSATLESRGMPAVLTGGSAAAMYAPGVNTSFDADYILEFDNRIDEVAVVLSDLGFERYGRSRMFTHPDSQYTIDFPKGPLAVGNDYIREFHVLRLRDLCLRILNITDCVRDRLAHYYYWDDYTALNAAVSVAATDIAVVDLVRIEAWTARESPLFLHKFEEFKRRLFKRK